MPLTLLCIATYLKGQEFLRECKRQGCRVLLLTEEKLRDADWPRDSIDEFLDDFPSVSREQVIAFLEQAREQLVAAAS